MACPKGLGVPQAGPPAGPGRQHQAGLAKHQQGPQPPRRPQTGGPLDRADSIRRVQGPLQTSRQARAVPMKASRRGPRAGRRHADRLSRLTAQARLRQVPDRPFAHLHPKGPEHPQAGLQVGGPLNRAGTRQVKTGLMQASSSPRQTQGKCGGPIAIAPGRLAWLDTLIDDIFVCHGCMGAHSRGTLGTECGTGWGMQNATLRDMKF